MNTKFFQFAVTIVLFVLMYGCASSDGTRDRQRTDRNLLTKEEIESVSVSNMYEVIDRLRPFWLRARGPVRSFVGETDILVYRDHMNIGNLEALRQISPDSVQSARFLDSSTAHSTLPGISRGQHIAGAIVLTSSTTR
jgi:hypothetical protein